jgi:hypothetical protein
MYCLNQTSQLDYKMFAMTALIVHRTEFKCVAVTLSIAGAVQGYGQDLYDIRGVKEPSTWELGCLIPIAAFLLSLNLCTRPC